MEAIGKAAATFDLCLMSAVAWMVAFACLIHYVRPKIRPLVVGATVGIAPLLVRLLGMAIEWIWRL